MSIFPSSSSQETPTLQLARWILHDFSLKREDLPYYRKSISDVEEEKGVQFTPKEIDELERHNLEVIQEAYKNAMVSAICQVLEKSFSKFQIKRILQEEQKGTRIPRLWSELQSTLDSLFGAVDRALKPVHDDQYQVIVEKAMQKLSSSTGQ